MPAAHWIADEGLDRQRKQQNRRGRGRQRGNALDALLLPRGLPFSLLGRAIIIACHAWTPLHSCLRHWRPIWPTCPCESPPFR
jgi:hypothetical protein